MSALSFPYPPAASRLWRLEGGRIVRTAAYQAWLGAVRAAVRASTQRSVFGPYMLSITAVAPAEADEAPELESLLKPLTAALAAAGLVGEEALADRIVVRWSRRRTPGGRLEVEARSA